METKLYKPGEVAEMLGIKVSTVRRWIFDRRLTVVKIGRAVRISSQEVERVIRSGVRPSITVNRSGGS